MYIGDYSSIRYWDRATYQITLICRCVSGTRNTVLFVTSKRGLLRLHTPTGTVTTLCPNLSPGGIAATPSGHLIVSYTKTESLYLISPNSGTATVIAGSGKAGYADGSGTGAAFNYITSLALNEREHCMYASDNQNNRIRRITLPASLFVRLDEASAAAKTSAPPVTVPSSAGVHSICEEREAKLSAELKAVSLKLQTVTAQLDAETRQRIAADSLAAASKLRISELERLLSDRDSKQFIAEMSDRQASEWSAGTVVYWVEHVFGREHKTAQITEFVSELKFRATGSSAVSGAALIAAAPMKQLRELELNDPQTIETLQGAIESLKHSKSSDSQQHSSSGAEPLPP